jgi:hypothetical protein
MYQGVVKHRVYVIHVGNPVIWAAHADRDLCPAVTIDDALDIVYCQAEPSQPVLDVRLCERTDAIRPTGLFFATRPIYISPLID